MPILDWVAFSFQSTIPLGDLVFWMCVSYWKCVHWSMGSCLFVSLLQALMLLSSLSTWIICINCDCWMRGLCSYQQRQKKHPMTALYENSCYESPNGDGKWNLGWWKSVVYVNEVCCFSFASRLIVGVRGANRTWHRRAVFSPQSSH